MSETIQDFTGPQFPFSTTGAEKLKYEANNVQYATSTHQQDHSMFPGLIALPKNDDDIQKAVRYARDNGYPVSVMSGGHQYSGACSTSGKGIMLNLKSTYKNGPQDLAVFQKSTDPKNDKTLVYASVSYSLGEFNEFLAANKLFVPHGQCVDVHLGGHAQTGGYGQLGRSFGLLGDHIRGIRLIDYNGEIRELTKDSTGDVFNGDLFNVILGGSPGNFGVITHYTIEVHRDEDHNFPETGATPHGLKGVWLYNETVLKALLKEIAVIAGNPEFPRNYDMCVSVLSSSLDIFKLVPEMEDDQDKIFKRIDKAMETDGGKELNGGTDWEGMEKTTKWPAVVVLYAQWVPMNAEDKYTPEVASWFQKFKDLNSFFDYWPLYITDFTEPMSVMTGKWLFPLEREFKYPYDKRTYMTNSTTLLQDNWVDQVTGQINRVVPFLDGDYDLWSNCYLSVQIQCFGGKNSQYYTNRENGTSYSWRDSTVCQVIDCFHKDTAAGKKLAQGWQAENDKIMIGENSPFSKTDKRVLWASYGDWHLDNSWQYYYEDEAKYKKIGVQRGLADPKGTFTPNPFNVKAIKG